MSCDIGKVTESLENEQSFYGVSVRYLYNFQSKVFISYFSHYKPVVPFWDYDNFEEDIDLQNLRLVPGDLYK